MTADSTHRAPPVPEIFAPRACEGCPQTERIREGMKALRFVGLIADDEDYEDLASVACAGCAVQPAEITEGEDDWGRVLNLFPPIG